MRPSPDTPAQAGHRACQDATFYYFTGLNVLQSFLLIRGGDGHSTVFLPTRDGCERLTGAAATELDEVEALMKEPSRIFVK